MIAEPCCAERQLPQIARQAGMGRVAVFQTNGDVLVSHLMRSLACLAGTQQRMTLAVQRELNIDTLRMLRYWLKRGWEDRIRLLTQTDQTAQVRAELAGYDDRVTVAVDAMVKGDVLCFEGDEGTVVVQGDMLCTVDPGLRSYSMVLARQADNDTVQAMLAPMESRLKMAERKRARAAKKKETTKKHKENEDTEEMEGTPRTEAATAGTGHAGTAAPHAD